MNEKGNLSFIHSWFVIILALCFFWPIGVFLIIRRVSIDKKTALVAWKLISGLGIASYCFAALGLLVSFSEGFHSDDFTLILFFLLAGFVLQKVSKKIKKDAENVRNYLSIIINGNITQLDAIASSTGKDYDVVKKDVHMLIQKGYLKNAYIDENSRAIVLPVNNNPQQSNITNNASSANIQTTLVACKCCGANNTLTGETGECEYCGSALNAK